MTVAAAAGGDCCVSRTLISMQRHIHASDARVPSLPENLRPTHALFPEWDSESVYACLPATHTCTGMHGGAAVVAAGHDVEIRIGVRETTAIFMNSQMAIVIYSCVPVDFRPEYSLSPTFTTESRVWRPDAHHIHSDRL